MIGFPSPVLSDEIAAAVPSGLSRVPGRYAELVAERAAVGRGVEETPLLRYTRDWTRVGAVGQGVSRAKQTLTSNVGGDAAKWFKQSV